MLDIAEKRVKIFAEKNVPLFTFEMSIIFAQVTAATKSNLI